MGVWWWSGLSSSPSVPDKLRDQSVLVHVPLKAQTVPVAL